MPLEGETTLKGEKISTAAGDGASVEVAGISFVPSIGETLASPSSASENQFSTLAPSSALAASVSSGEDAAAAACLDSAAEDSVVVVVSAGVSSGNVWLGSTLVVSSLSVE